MDSTFKIGEIVVCINDKRRWFRLGGLKKNEMYTVVGFNSYDGGLILKEVKSPRSGQHAYRADRFRKVDYNFAEKVVAKVQQPQPEEEYDLVAKEIELSMLN